LTQKIKRLPKAKATNFAMQDSIKSKLAWYDMEYECTQHFLMQAAISVVFVHGFITWVYNMQDKIITFLPNDFICLLTLKRTDLGEGKNWWPPLCIQVGGFIFGVFLVTEVKARKESPYEGFVLRIPNWSAIDSVHALGSNFRNNCRHCPSLHNLKPWEEENRQWNFFSLVWIPFTLCIRLDYSLIVQVITW
jgi:hypothetical protein